MNDASPSMQHVYPRPGEILEGKYQIEKIIGEGGMGAVAKATHLLRRAPVALKFMNPLYLSVPGAVDRFRNEGVAASQIQNDHVVHIYDVGVLPTGAPFLVMEYLEGCDLAALLIRDGRPGLPIPRAIHFTLQALRGLQIAHHKGIVHRDMKPSNCFIVHKDGEDDFVKLLDFGISKVKQPDGAALTQTNSALGTPLYMSPEQAKNPRDVDARSDIYSVGVILYELLSGRTPFFSESGEFTEILFKLFTAEPPPIRSARPDVPEGLAAVVHRALAREPEHRFQDVAQLAEALAPYAGPESAQILQRIRSFGLPPGSRVAASAVGPHVSLRPPPQSAFPPGMGTHPNEVLAATQLGATGEVAPPTVKDGGPLARTDLGAARDTTLGGQAPRKKGPAMWLLLGAAALVATALAVGLAIGAKKGAATPAPSHEVLPPPSALIVVPPPVVPSATPSATPSAEPSAEPSAKQPKPPAPHVDPRPPKPPCDPGKPCLKE